MTRSVREASIVFAVLALATLSTFYMSRLLHGEAILRRAAGLRGTGLWPLLLLLALMKVALIFHFFMDVRIAPCRLAIVAGLWLVVVGGGIAVFLSGAL